MRTLEQNVAPLLVARDLHPHLENMRAFTYRNPAIVSDFLPGKAHRLLTLEEASAITKD